MSEKNSSSKKSFSLDWLIQGVLTKLGETFDGLTGRKWKPSSSLATSQLVEKLKHLLDAEVQDLGAKGKFVPHNLKLKMQWDKFSTDAEIALKKLEAELLTAAVDHINDNRYHTFAPLKLEVKPDYFTDGVKLLVSFDKFADEDRDAEVNVTLPEAKAGELYSAQTTAIDNGVEIFIAQFASNGITQKVKLRFQNNGRLSVGRTRENDLNIDDASVSKVHASLFLNSDNYLTIADTGSTNGTFINGERISYGKAHVIGKNDRINFGTVDVSFEYVPKPIETAVENNLPVEKSVTIDGFEFKSKSESNIETDGEMLNQKTTKITVE
ncbi:MAG: FHA domain-containing protein [Pyrinomonadaceae bacterium]